MYIMTSLQYAFVCETRHIEDEVGTFEQPKLV